MSQHHAQIKNDPRWKAARVFVLDRDGQACVECEATEDLTVDHHPVPLWRLVVEGGDPFDVDNLVVRCRSCNSRKGGRESERVRVTWVNEKFATVVGFLTGEA